MKAIAKTGNSWTKLYAISDRFFPFDRRLTADLNAGEGEDMADNKQFTTLKVRLYP